MTPHRIGQETPDTNGVLIDHEKRIGSMESEFKVLSLQVQASLNGMEELKTIVIQGNKDQMQFFKDIIGHEHGMEKAKTDFKQHMEQMDLEIKQKQMETQEKLLAERETWQRQQKEQNRQMWNAAMRKIFLYAAPIITAIVTYINYLINNYLGGPV